MVRVSSSIEISTSLRSRPGISALISIALSVSEMAMFGIIFALGPTPCANSLNSRSISRWRPNNPKSGRVNAPPSRNGTSDVSLMGTSLLSWLIAECCVVSAETALLRTDHDAVFDLGDAGRRPGDALGFLALDPGANGAFQRHHAAVRFDGDPIGIHLGISLECVLDLALELRGFHLRLHRNDVVDTRDALHFSHRDFSSGFLILPLRRAFQSDPAVPDDDLDPVVRDRQFRLQGCDSIFGNVRIGPLIDRRQPDLDVIRDSVNSGDALRSEFGFNPVGVAMSETRQRDDAIFDRDGDVLGINKMGFPLEFIADIAFYFTVGFHDWLLVWIKGQIWWLGGIRYRSRPILPEVTRAAMTTINFRSRFVGRGERGQFQSGLLAPTEAAA